MFAPKVPKVQTKALENSFSKMPERSTLLAHRLGHDSVEQALLRQRTSRGNSWDFSKIPSYPPDRLGSSSQSSIIQRKLVVGQPNDPLEDEADRVAGQVVQMSAVEASSAPVQLEAAPVSVEKQVAGSGGPLAPVLRRDLEQRFGYDFSRVRVHSDALAARSAQDVNAHAYTVGDHIVFGAGQFSPDTQDGRRLIAHELTHVIQQTAPRSLHSLSGGRSTALASGLISPNSTIGSQAVPKTLGSQPGTSAMPLEEKHLQRRPDDPGRFKRVPPGPGAFTEAQYDDWQRHRRHGVLHLPGPWLGKDYEKFTPDWFLARGFFYSGKMNGPNTSYFEIWLRNDGDEYRVLRDPQRKKEPSGEQPEEPELDDPELDEAERLKVGIGKRKYQLILKIGELVRIRGTAAYDGQYRAFRQAEDKWLSDLETDIDTVRALLADAPPENEQELKDVLDELETVERSHPYGPEWGERANLPGFPGDWLKIKPAVTITAQPGQPITF